MSFALFLLATVAGPATSILYWLGYAWRAPSRARTIVKALPMGILFAWLWVFSDDVGDSPIPWVVLFAWLGDILLSRPGERAFLFGMISFAIAHLFVIAMFFDLGISVQALRFGPALGVLGLAFFMAGLLWERTGALRYPVLGYVVIIAVMGVVGMAIATPSGRVNETILWAVALFLVSDTLLAFETFVAPKHWRVPLSLCVWPTYYLAMVFFAAAAPG